MKKGILKKILICLISIIALVLLFVISFIIFASATTLKVKDREEMPISKSINNTLSENAEITVLTWNMGYGGLDERQDCYLDGGKGVDAESKEKVLENTIAIENTIKGYNPDIIFIQEVDINSKRSYKTDELTHLKTAFSEDVYQNSFALNFKAGFIPIPLYNPIGKVEAGIASFSKYQMSTSTRVQLPIPFTWPVSLLNLKRCLLVNRIKIDGSDKELVTINFHLEAYDDGEGKAKQLKQLMDIIKEEYDKGNYVIAGGDFNQTFSNVDLSKYPKRNDWVCPIINVDDYDYVTFNMDDRTPTCRSLYKTYYDSDKPNHQFYMIDGFIVTNNIKVNTIETIDLDFKNSDHNPVIMNIKLQ